mgnify:CR=1 FL=1
MIRQFIVVFGVIALLQGCATPFAQFYYDQTGGADITKLPSVVLPTGEPKVYRGNDQEQDALRMFEDNYNLVGYSSFNAGNVDENGAVTQAKKVNASVVILYSKYTGSVSGSVPLTLPDTRTSSTSLSGSAYGSGGYASYSGTAYTTTYGTQTTYIPYTVHRSDYLATYWIKMKPPIFGTHIRDLTPEIKQQIGSNKGVLIYAVIKESPAFEADILKGDVLRKIGDIAVFDGESYQKALTEYQGREVDVLIIRGDKELHKSVKLGMRS